MVAAVGYGGDTSAIASMAGALFGALHGDPIEWMPPQWRQDFESSSSAGSSGSSGGTTDTTGSVSAATGSVSAASGSGSGGGSGTASPTAAAAPAAVSTSSSSHHLSWDDIALVADSVVNLGALSVGSDELSAAKELLSERLVRAADTKFAFDLDAEKRRLLSTQKSHEG